MRDYFLHPLTAKAVPSPYKQGESASGVSPRKGYYLLLTTYYLKKVLPPPSFTFQKVTSTPIFPYILLFNDRVTVEKCSRKYVLLPKKRPIVSKNGDFFAFLFVSS